MDAIKFKLSKYIGVSFAEKPAGRSIAQSKIPKDDESDRRRSSKRARSQISDE